MPTKSTDTTAPTSTITQPTASSSIAAGDLVTVKGTASDVGGRVAGVEVSVDGGATFHPADGTERLQLHRCRSSGTGPGRDPGAGDRRLGQHRRRRRSSRSPRPAHARSSARCSRSAASHDDTLSRDPRARSSPSPQTASSRASASTRAPATPAPTSARSTRPPAPVLATANFTQRDHDRLAERQLLQRRAGRPRARPTSPPTTHRTATTPPTATSSPTGATPPGGWPRLGGIRAAERRLRRRRQLPDADLQADELLRRRRLQHRRHHAADGHQGDARPGAASVSVDDRS